MDAHPQKPEPEPHPSQITLNIAYNGVTKPLEHVAVHEQVEAILKRAVTLFNVTDRPHAQGLFREDGSEVTPTQSVQDAGLIDGQLLYLRARTPQGGRR